MQATQNMMKIRPIMPNFLNAEEMLLEDLCKIESKDARQMKYNQKNLSGLTNCFIKKLYKEDIMLYREEMYENKYPREK